MATPRLPYLTKLALLFAKDAMNNQNDKNCAVIIVGVVFFLLSLFMAIAITEIPHYKCEDANEQCVQGEPSAACQARGERGVVQDPTALPEVAGAHLSVRLCLRRPRRYCRAYRVA